MNPPRDRKETQTTAERSLDEKYPSGCQLDPELLLLSQRPLAGDPLLSVFVTLGEKAEWEKWKKENKINDQIAWTRETEVEKNEAEVNSIEKKYKKILTWTEVALEKQASHSPQKQEPPFQSYSSTRLESGGKTTVKKVQSRSKQSKVS